MKALKFAFEINWPLEELGPGVFQLSTSRVNVPTLIEYLFVLLFQARPQQWHQDQLQKRLCGCPRTHNGNSGRTSRRCVFVFHSCYQQWRKFLAFGPQFYIQLVYKPHFGTWILLFGPFRQLRTVRKKSRFEFFWATFEGGFFNFLRAKNFFENFLKTF